VLEVARQSDLSDWSGVTEEQCDKVVAGVMAIKAFAQSNSGTCSYGSALKTARVAWEKDGTDLGNLVILFHCSFRYEVFQYEYKRR